MKAAIRTGLFGYTFSFIQDYPIPPFDEHKNNSNKVYIKVKAAGINPVDYKLPRFLAGKTIGIDFCGTIEKIGSSGSGSGTKASSFQVGDEVFGTSSSGSLAEYCIADIDKIAKVSNSAITPSTSASSDWNPSDYAALPVAYMSALQSLRIGKVISDTNNYDDASTKSVLIIGASGGCGIAGIQLCKAMGVGRIVGICSSKNADFVKELGATEVISYSNQDELKVFLKANNAQFDCVYDAATNSGGGEDYWNQSLDLLKKDSKGKLCGDYVALNGPVSKWIRALFGCQKEHESIMMMNSNRTDLELIFSLLNITSTKPITNSYAFCEEGLKDAFKQLKSRRTRGKILFQVSNYRNVKHKLHHEK